MEIVELSFSADTSDIKSAGTDLDQLALAGNRASGSVNSLSKSIVRSSGSTFSFVSGVKSVKQNVTQSSGALNKLSSSFRIQSNATQQASFQVQDFFVQLGAGQGAFRAFSQQAPQFFSIFGPGGAILGGIAAVVGAIGGPLIASLFNAGEAANRLDDILQDIDDTAFVTSGKISLLTEEFEELAKESRSAAINLAIKELAKNSEAADKAFSALTKRTKDLNVEFRNGIPGAQFATNGTARLAVSLGLTTEQVRSLTKSLKGITTESTVSELEAVDEEITELNKKFGENSPKLRKFAEGFSGNLVSLIRFRKAVSTSKEVISDLDGALDQSSESSKKRTEDEIERQKKLAASQDEAARKAIERIERGLLSEEAGIRKSAMLQDNAIVDAQERGIIGEEKAAALIEANRAKRDEKLANTSEQRELEAQAKKLERLKMSLLSEEEAIAESELRRLEIISQSEANNQIGRKEADELRLALQEETEDKLFAILLKGDKAEIEQKINQSTLLAKIEANAQTVSAQLAANGSKIGFRISQAIALKNATIKGIEAIQSAVAYGNLIGGPPLGAVFGAAAGALNGALIGQIASESPPNISGGRAFGGQVRPGEAYRVGEFGPETLVMGSSGGFISPQDPQRNPGQTTEPIQLTTNVKVVGGSPNTEVSNTTTQISDRQFIQDILIEEMSDQNSRTRNGLHQTSNVMPRGGL